MNSRELNSTIASLMRSAIAGRTNHKAAAAVAGLGAVLVRNAGLELQYAKLQKGKIKVDYFEPCESSKEI